MAHPPQTSAEVNNTTIPPYVFMAKLSTRTTLPSYHGSYTDIPHSPFTAAHPASELVLQSFFLITVNFVFDNSYWREL
jgi:hypothetical protein